MGPVASFVPAIIETTASYLPAVLGAVSAGVGMYQQKKAAKEAKSIAARNAANEQKVTDEKVSRMQEDNRRRAALARARAAASGVGGESTQVYIDALNKSGREEIDWLKAVGQSAYDKAIGEGRIAYNDAMTGFWGSVGKGVSAASSMWSTYQNTAKDLTTVPSGAFNPSSLKR